MEQVILLDRVRGSIGDGSVIQNMIFAGDPGTGKTSLAKILARTRDSLYINASEERGIDTVRETIMDFCSTVSIEGKEKLIILDEVDGAADLFFKALRATIEKFPEVRFIATCNYVNKVPQTMFSRLLLLDFNPKTKDEEKELHLHYAKRIKNISKKVGIEWETTDVLLEFVKRNFPDMRKIVNKLQDLVNSGTTLVETKNIKSLSYSYNDLFEKILEFSNNPQKNYALIVGEYSNRVEDVFEAIGREFIPWLEDNYPEKYVTLYPPISIAIADYQSKRKLVIDPVIALLALIYTIQEKIKTK